MRANTERPNAPGRPRSSRDGARHSSEDAPELTDRIALYLRIASLIRSKISGGAWTVDTRLPTVVELAEHYNVSRITIRQALGLLSQEGLIDSRRGRGTLVIAVPAHPPALPSLLELGKQYRTDRSLAINVLEVKQATTISPEFELHGRPSGRYTFIKKLHMYEGSVFCLSTIYLCEELAKLCPRRLIELERVTSALSEIFVERKSLYFQRITVSEADVATAGHLKVGVAAPIAIVHREYLSPEGEILMVSQGRYRSDRFASEERDTFEAMLKRQAGPIAGRAAPAKSGSTSAARAPRQRGGGADRPAPAAALTETVPGGRRR